MKEKIFEKVVFILQKQCDVKTEIVEQSHFQQDLHLDSVGLMSLITAVEMVYQIDFEDLRDPPQTVGELVKLIERKV